MQKANRIWGITERKGIENKTESFFCVDPTLCAVSSPFLTKAVVGGNREGMGWCWGSVKRCRSVWHEKINLSNFIVLPRDFRLLHMKPIQAWWCCFDSLPGWEGWRRKLAFTLANFNSVVQLSKILICLTQNIYLEVILDCWVCSKKMWWIAIKKSSVFTLSKVGDDLLVDESHHWSDVSFLTGELLVQHLFSCFLPDVLSGVVTVFILSCYYICDFMTCGVFTLDTCSLHCYEQELVLSKSSWVLLMRKYLPTSVPLLSGMLPKGVMNRFQWGNTFSGASFQQPASYIAIAGRTSLSCWSPHREISLFEWSVRVWFVHRHLSLHLLSFCTFLLQNWGRISESEKSLRNNMRDDLLLHSFRSPKSRRQGCLRS